jgi:RNA 3'-terminal phosphate cyclase (ATP)
MVEIDGSLGAGGGQVLRTSLTLSAMTGRPVTIRNIRRSRPKPGLAPQHLTNVLALGRVCRAEIEGAGIGSQRIVFSPTARPQGGAYRFDVADVARGGSAGSVTLILQTLLLPLAGARRESQLVLLGGTHVPWSPSFEYLLRIYLPVVGRMGIRASCQLEAWGFYPVGGGRIAARIEPDDGPGAPRDSWRFCRLTDRGPLCRVTGTAVACNLPAHIAQRMSGRAYKLVRDAGLAERGTLDIEITPQKVRGGGPGAAIFLAAEYEGGVCGFTALGRKGKASETVAEEACQELVAHHATGAPCDRYLADQLLLPAALASGRTEYRTGAVTCHLVTNAEVIHAFLPGAVQISGREGEAGTVVVQGQGIAPLPAE